MKDKRISGSRQARHAARSPRRLSPEEAVETVVPWIAHYKIDPSLDWKEQCLQVFCRLAFDGLLPRPRNDRGRRLKAREKLELLEAVDAIFRGEPKTRSNPEAIKVLRERHPDTWGRIDQSPLVKRYREARKAIRPAGRVVFLGDREGLVEHLKKRPNNK